MTQTTPDDPEVARIEALLAGERGGTASEAEREELAIYAAERPELAGRLAENARAAELGAGWLHRVEHDERRLAVERGSRARIERGAGLGLMLVGWLLHFPLPIGLVRGNTVRARHLGVDFLAGLKNLIGGEIADYTKMLAESREQSLDRMRAEALGMGANAIVGVRFATSTVMQGAAEMLVYGTAVVLERTV